MTTKTNNPKSGRKKLPANKRNHKTGKYNEPFWLPATNYYFFALLTSFVFFVLIRVFFHDEADTLEFLPVSVAALIFFGSVFLREVVFRKARNQILSTQKQLDRNLENLSAKAVLQNGAGKLTIEKNAEIIKQIRRKSEAAKTLNKLPAAHFEVFEICNDYLLTNSKALETAGAGSPRIGALRRGREIVGQIHKYHLLVWAGLESKLLTQTAKAEARVAEKLKIVEKAQEVLKTALRFYPNESQLLESDEVLKEFVATIKISHFIEQAERAKMNENYRQAIAFYRDALFFLARENVAGRDAEIIAEKINAEIEAVRRHEETAEFKNRKITKENIKNIKEN